MKGKSWKLAKHNPDCNAGKCAKIYDTRAHLTTFRCPKCNRTFGLCMGGAPSPLCDECFVKEVPRG